ncbi:MAG: hypothetical protein QOC95_2272, partial [Thermoleophilaceae bacterium]|nr:hypothetical protein [Thermoleophilaceae bacterium]
AGARSYVIDLRVKPVGREGLARGHQHALAVAAGVGAQGACLGRRCDVWNT